MFHSSPPRRLNLCKPLGLAALVVAPLLLGAGGCTQALTQRQFIEHRTMVAKPVPMLDTPSGQRLVRR